MDMASMKRDDEARDGWAMLIEIAKKLLLIPGLQGMGKADRGVVGEAIELVHTFVVHNRPARIALFGTAEGQVERLIEALIGPAYFGDMETKRHLGRRRWYDFENGGGQLRLLDGTQELGDLEAQETTCKALGREQADLTLLLCAPSDLDDPEFLNYLDGVSAQMSESYEEPVVTIVALTLPRAEDTSRARTQVRQSLRRTGFGRHTIQLAACYAPKELVEQLVRFAPDASRFELAAVVPSPKAKHQVAEELTGAFTKISAAMSGLRLPVADLVPLTALHVGLVVAIARLGGRQITWATGLSFLVRLGFQMGALRVASRGVHRLVRSVPLARPFLSAGVSASTTQVIGVAARRHFIGEQR